MTINDEVTITVSRDDLAVVLYAAYNDYAHCAEAATRISSAVPPWEPTGEQCSALRAALDELIPGWYGGVPGARQILEAAYRKGLRIP